MNRTARFAAAIAVGIVFFGAAAYAAVASAESAIRSAAKQNRYVFVTFHKKGDAASTQMLADIKKIQSKYSKRASFISASVGDSSNRALIKRYGVDRAPMPLTIVLAPNGAVTGGFPRTIKNANLSSVFVSKGKADVLKALQAQKMAVVCLQNSRTKHNKQSLTAANGLNSDPQFEGQVRVIRIDPKSSADSAFLRSLKVNTNSKEAQIVVLAPPGKVLGTFSGASTTRAIAASLANALGCGTSSGGCAPGG